MSKSYRNAKYFEIVRNSARLDSVYLQSPEKIMMRTDKGEAVFQFYNKVYNHKSLSEARMYYLGTTLRRATNLIGMLKREYHVE